MKSLLLVTKDAGIKIADPTGLGGSLRVSTTAGDSFDDTYVLGASKWKRIGKPSAVKGYRYRDKSGPIKSVIVKNGESVTAVGKGGQLGLTLGGNPDPVQVVVTTGTQHDCMSFAGGKFAPGKKYLAINSAPPAACP